MLHLPCATAFCLGLLEILQLYEHYLSFSFSLHYQMTLRDKRKFLSLDKEKNEEMPGKIQRCFVEYQHQVPLAFPYLFLLPRLRMILSLQHINALLLPSPGAPSSPAGFLFLQMMVQRIEVLYEGMCLCSSFLPKAFSLFKPLLYHLCPFVLLLRDFPLLTFLLIKLIKLIFPLSHLPYHSHCLARAQ